MQKNYMLSTVAAEQLYDGIRDLPIVDYHCHLSPKEIYEDALFDNIGVMWLAGDHYKWRLMRTAGIEEYYITGAASWREKFQKYAEALELAAGHPLYHWSHMELSMFFGIDESLTAANADRIYDAAGDYIREHALSPRKLILSSGVESLCTTDDIVDDLAYHAMLRADDSFAPKVLPSFRTDNLLLIARPGYGEYIARLSAVSGVEVADIHSLKAAVEKRLAFFVSMGCKCTDVGIPSFPDHVATEAEANAVFVDALAGKPVEQTAYLGFVGYMYQFLGRLYKQYDLLMQWHLAVYRNANSALFGSLGADCGVDCVGDVISGTAIIKMLDAINRDGGLPETVLYTLNPGNASQIASIAGAFPRVRCGAAWWFCDHKRGIREEMEIIGENAALGCFLGMLTDSRSFLSYARHDYFRRILADMLGDWVEKGEYPLENARVLAHRVAYGNIHALMEG